MSDGRIRLIILACLNAGGEADLRFISHLTNGVSEAERQRSLAWLEEQGCIIQRRRWRQRDFPWQRRVEDIYFAITPVGRFLRDQTIASLQGDNPREVSVKRSVWRPDALVLGIVFLVIIGIIVVQVLSTLH